MKVNERGEYESRNTSTINFCVPVRPWKDQYFTVIQNNCNELVRPPLLFIQDYILAGRTCSNRDRMPCHSVTYKQVYNVQCKHLISVVRFRRDSLKINPPNFLSEEGVCYFCLTQCHSRQAYQRYIERQAEMPATEKFDDYT